MGLSIASTFASAGCRVSVVADNAAAQSVSAVAEAIWFPYQTENSAWALDVIAASRREFEKLALTPETGVDIRWGTYVERPSVPDRRWTTALESFTEATSEQLPEGATSGVRARLPLIAMPMYLEWLTAACTAHGVEFHKMAVLDLDQVSA